MFKKIKVLCLGVKVLEGNKKGYGYAVLDTDGNETEDVMLFKNFVGAAGNIYNVEYSKKSSQVRGVLKWCNKFHDEKRVVELRVLSDAAESEITAIQQAKKARSDRSDVLNALIPIRKAWFKTNGVGRLALEIRVLHYLRNGENL